MSSPMHWTSALELRDEVVQRRGHAHHLQMSLFDAVYQTTDVPYREAVYWCDITEPTPKLVGFMADIAARLGASADGQALYWLDQGMGGGKSHALVGLYHLVTSPREVLGTDVGAAVAAEARARAGAGPDLTAAHAVVLTADHFTPGVTSTEFGPASNLHERFLWSLFEARDSKAGRRKYDEFAARGTDKAALKDALRASGRPVLILLDELMDYGMNLAGQGVQSDVEAEQAFLSALFDVVDDVPHVALVVVMISTEADEHGYEGTAGDFRAYVSSRLDRNNAVRSSVNEAQDFGAIIRRRIFKQNPAQLPVDETASAWLDSADSAWRSNVFDRLPGDRQLARLSQRLASTYPFHPDLLDLVEKDWVSYSGFQRVRSTVEIFATTAYYWSKQNEHGDWSPPLISVGDIPLHTAVEQVLSSGVLHGNDRTITALRQVAQLDVVNVDRTHGYALNTDAEFNKDGRSWASSNPRAAERLATALWMYSLVPRGNTKRGATKAELLAATFVPDSSFTFPDAEEIFNNLTDFEEGLGSLDVMEGSGGNTPARYRLATSNNLRMFHRTAKSRVSPDDAYRYIWERTRHLANGGANFDVILIEAPADQRAPAVEIFADVDQRHTNRLVVLDPQRWTLLNGRDSATRDDIQAMLGIGDGTLAPSFAASCIVACVNTQRRDKVVKRAREAVAWQVTVQELRDSGTDDREFLEQAERELRQAQDAHDRDLKSAFQHICHLERDSNATRLRVLKLDADGQSALSGNMVWARLESDQRAVSTDGLSGAYLHQLLDLGQRQYTLAEVVRKFWSDPTFPLAPREETVRRSIFRALEPDEDGIAWELVTSDGRPLEIRGPDELAVRASDQYLRIARPQDSTDSDDQVDDPTTRSGGASGTTSDEAAPGGTRRSGSATSGEHPGTYDRDADAVEYVWHELMLDTASLTDEDRRRRLWDLVSKLETLMDPGEPNSVQLVEMRVRLNAARGSLPQLKSSAEDAGARWIESEEDDFGF